MPWLRAGSFTQSIFRSGLMVVGRSTPARHLSYTSTPWTAPVFPSLQKGPSQAGSWLSKTVMPNRSIATVAPQSREEILKLVQGQTLRLPDLERLFDGWPRVVNPHQDRIKDVVDDVLQRYTVSPTVLAKLTKCNLSFLLATWYPFANIERLAELAYFVCWMFIVDDEADTITAKGRNGDSEFHDIWDETLRVIGESCALNGEEDGKEWRRSKIESVESFRGIGQWLKRRYTIEQRQRFWNEIERTANSYRKEHNIRKGVEVLQYDAYFDYRYGSSCMAQVISMIEYANGSHLPEEIMESPEMKALWAETTKLLWINNDIISIKKEIADDFLENLVVIASEPGYKLQDGLDHCVEKLRQAIIGVDETASVLKARYVGSKNDEIAREVDRFITNCRSMSIGTSIWSQTSPRYGLLEEPRDAAGYVTFTLGKAPL